MVGSTPLFVLVVAIAAFASASWPTMPVFPGAHVCIAASPLKDSIKECMLGNDGNKTFVLLVLPAGDYDLAPGDFDAAIGASHIDTFSMIGAPDPEAHRIREKTVRVHGSIGAGDHPFILVLNRIDFDFEKYGDCAMGSYLFLSVDDCTFRRGKCDAIFDTPKHGQFKNSRFVGTNQQDISFKHPYYPGDPHGNEEQQH